MSQRDDCRICAHAKDSHYSEIATTKDERGGQTRRREWYACLASFCKCMQYVKPAEDGKP